jgi:hypothetical protein
VDAEVAKTSGAYERYAVAFRMRAEAARKLGGLYTALGGLSSSDIAKTTGTAAENLSKSVTSLPELKGELQFDPSTLTGMIATDLMALKQASDIKTASAVIARVLDGVANLLDAERGAAPASSSQPTTQPAARPGAAAPTAAVGNNLYRAVITRRSHLAGELAEMLIDKGYVDPSGVMKQLADTYGIPWNGEIKADDKDTRAAAAKVQAFELARQGELTAAAADDIAASLRELAAQHVRFQKTGAFDPSQAQALAERAKAYIDEVENIRKQIKAAEDQRKQDKKDKNKKPSSTQPGSNG